MFICTEVFSSIVLRAKAESSITLPTVKQPGPVVHIHEPTGGSSDSSSYSAAGLIDFPVPLKSLCPAGGLCGPRLGRVGWRARESSAVSPSWGLWFTLTDYCCYKAPVCFQSSFWFLFICFVFVGVCVIWNALLYMCSFYWLMNKVVSANGWAE